MATTQIILTVINTIVPALTPLERWEAAGSRLNFEFIAEHWFALAAVLLIIILTVILSIVCKKQATHQQKVISPFFTEHSAKSGLSKRERQLLLEIAKKAGLKRNEAIFTMGSAFDKGAAKLTEESMVKDGAEESKGLRIELSFLREKLGFQKRIPVSIGAPTKPNTPSSRQIPVGKKIHITRRKTRNLADIETTVIKNNDIELTVKLTTPLESKAGDLWRARYYFGASVWEFDTSVIYCNGDILVLNHSENIRFINRRRFLRVPVNKPALIALFPFSVTPQQNKDNIKKDSEEEQTATEPVGDIPVPPEFTAAVVTELAGPGLRIETPLQVEVGDRVLVVLRLSEEDSKDSNQTHRRSAVSIVEDIGEVRHTKAIQNGLSIAVEFTGISDSNVNDLIRATNEASLKAGAKNQRTPEAADQKEQTEGTVTKPAVTQEA